KELAASGRPAAAGFRGTVQRRTAAAGHDVDRTLAVAAEVINILRPLIDMIVAVENNVDAVLLELRSPGAARRQTAAERGDTARTRVGGLMKERELPLPRGGSEIVVEPVCLGRVAGIVRIENHEMRVAIVEREVAFRVGPIARKLQQLDLDGAGPIGSAHIV